MSEAEVLDSPIQDSPCIRIVPTPQTSTYIAFYRSDSWLLAQTARKDLEAMIKLAARAALDFVFARLRLQLP